MSAWETLYHAYITEEGQVTLPTEILNILGVTNGERIIFIAEGNTVRIANPAVYAMQRFQQDMEGTSECTDFISEDAIISLMQKFRNGNQSHIE